MSSASQSDPDFYAPDHRLSQAYDEATLLDDEGLEALCPSYIELAEVDTRYRDGDPLGQGAVKDVYRTYDSRTKRWIAMARLRQDRGPEFYDIFVHEAWLTSSLSHPNIIKVHDVGVDGVGRPFFTMDLKGNTSLADLVKEPKQADRRQLLEIFVKVCDAVAYAHSCGVIHLDLKPENIQTDAFGDVLVCDWGLGKEIGEVEEGEDDIPETLRPLDNMTLVGQIKGTPGYMAPEQVTPKSPKDQRTDIFSLGCILHLILTGHPPFTGTRDKVLDATIRANVAPPRLRYPHLVIPDSLQAVVMKATARNPDERYQTSISLQQEIHSYLDGYSTRAEQPGFFREALLFIRRNRTAAVITFLALVVLTTLSVLFVQDIRHQQQATAAERNRASRLESKADTMSALYLNEIAQSEEHRVQLAAKLATSANSIKNLGIFQRPVMTVREAHELAATALALDPGCDKARAERFSLNCISLNFREALAHPPAADYEQFEYIDFARAFPDFAFTNRSRPTTTNLVSFYRRAREISPNCGPLMERIASYDFAARRDKSSYVQVVGALLEYLNGGKDHLIIAHAPKNSSLFLWSDRAASLLIPSGSGSGECLLRFLPFRTLKLDITGQLNLSDLQLLPIESLDLRECGNVVLHKPVSLPRLREIHIRSGQIEPKTLRRRIQTTERLQIIEDPERP